MIPNALFNPRILVVSIGNPLPAYSSLHSAGHFAVNAAVRHVPEQPPFSGIKFGGQRCLVSHGPLFTFVQSPTYMNVSGPFVHKAWRETLTTAKQDMSGLVVVHDELEKDFLDVRPIKWDASHRGHNGIKSIKEQDLAGKFSAALYKRIAIGIGRPESRLSNDVADYVLKPLSQDALNDLQDTASVRLVQELLTLETQWRDRWLKSLGK
ncbi:mitochondrial peptidyl-tRNA hydrolase [Stachybotrys elegans]|uniref:peptidyl-tRNA hydrolase n=1 Tax=Stachybotrys elegans TaxID=80388 RepID=A0A8K0SLH6_9HYPO|nr:mitochondrial peptidyl-tRNA hydrolase [Stachybotrys elegans]